MNDYQELWAEIPGYANYEASTWGQVRRKGAENPLKPHLEKNGYLRMRLGRNSPSLRVHRLVSLTFLPNPDDLPEVDHKNGVRTNNRLSNLKWASRSDNMRNTGRKNNNQSGYKHISSVALNQGKNHYWTIRITTHDIQHKFNKEAWSLQQVYDIRNNLYEEYDIKRFD